MSNAHQQLQETYGVRIFITTAYFDEEPVGTFKQFASIDKYKKHLVVDNPADADVILFIENSRYYSDRFFRQIKKNPIVKQYPDKVFMYNPHDTPWFVLPGMYTCMPKERFDSGCMVASPYIESVNPYIYCDFGAEPKYLFSFYGSPHSAPRKKIAHLRHPRALIISGHQNMYSNDKPKDAQLRYADLLAESKFVLCPKGLGTSSIRLFEVLQAGRVPVIISDDLVLPKGPLWHELAVFVPEDQVRTIPQRLEAEEANWLEKARLAREAWETFFAPDALFDYFVDSLMVIRQNKGRVADNLQQAHYVALARWAFRTVVIGKIKKVISHAKKLRVRKAEPALALRKTA